MKINTKIDNHTMSYEDIPNKTMFKVVKTKNKFLEVECVHYKVYEDLVLLFLEGHIDHNDGDEYKDAECVLVHGSITLTF